MNSLFSYTSNKNFFHLAEGKYLVEKTKAERKLEYKNQKLQAVLKQWYIMII